MGWEKLISVASAHDCSKINKHLLSFFEINTPIFPLEQNQCALKFMKTLIIYIGDPTDDVQML